MTIQELIEMLEEIRDSHDLGEELPVLVATQPNWPLAFELETVRCNDVGDGDVAWVVASDRHPRDRSPYAPGDVYE